MRVLALAILLCAACQSPPPCEYRVDSGLVRANAVAEARTIAIMAQSYSMRVAQELKVYDALPFVIYYDDSGPGRNHVRHWLRDGRIVKARIELWADAWPGMPYALVHELVHWHVKAGPPWNRLPVALEEGLADYLACAWVDQFKPERMQRLEDALDGASEEQIESARGMTMEKWAKGVPQGREHTLVYAVGYRVVERIGVEGLRALCERAEREGLATVPMEWVKKGADGP